jgi:hypothetical protein
MKSLSTLTTEVYQNLSKKYSNLIERKEATKQYILTEITHWTIKSLYQGKNYYFKPFEFNGTENSKPFEVRLVLDQGNGYHELKFGNLNADSPKDQYEWDDKDPYKLQKSLFLIKVLETKVMPMILDGTIKGLEFVPFDQDGLGDDRLSYFYNMFSKLGKDKVEWKSMGGMYFIYKKQ